MKTLSIRQPWAWLILNAGKNIENRSWPTNFRGRFLIHAAKACTRDEFCCSLIWCEEFRQATPSYNIERGGIVGVAELVDCVRSSPSPWFAGPFGFVVRNAKPLPFYPCRGKLGFFDTVLSGEPLE